MLRQALANSANRLWLVPNIRRVYGDRYSGEWSRTEFRRLGLAYLDAPGTRSELYISLSSALNAGRVELPPCQMLERQLTGLERRTSRGGRDIKRPLRVEIICRIGIIRGLRPFEKTRPMRGRLIRCLEDFTDTERDQSF